MAKALRSQGRTTLETLPLCLLEEIAGSCEAWDIATFHEVCKATARIRPCVKVFQLLLHLRRGRWPSNIKSLFCFTFVERAMLGNQIELLTQCFPAPAHLRDLDICLSEQNESVLGLALIDLRQLTRLRISLESSASHAPPFFPRLPAVKDLVVHIRECFTEWLVLIVIKQLVSACSALTNLIVTGTRHYRDQAETVRFLAALAHRGIEKLSLPVFSDLLPDLYFDLLNRSPRTEVTLCCLHRGAPFAAVVPHQAHSAILLGAVIYTWDEADIVLTDHSLHVTRFSHCKASPPPPPILDALMREEQLQMVSLAYIWLDESLDQVLMLPVVELRLFPRESHPFINANSSTMIRTHARMTTLLISNGVCCLSGFLRDSPNLSLINLVSCIIVEPPAQQPRGREYILSDSTFPTRRFLF